MKDVKKRVANLLDRYDSAIKKSNSLARAMEDIRSDAENDPIAENALHELGQQQCEINLEMISLHSEIKAYKAL